MGALDSATLFWGERAWLYRWIPANPRARNRHRTLYLLIRLPHGIRTPRQDQSADNVLVKYPRKFIIFTEIFISVSPQKFLPG